MAYIGSTPVPSGIKETQSFVASAGQTTFNTLGYSNGNNISVFLNGVRLINGTDYTATNGSDIVLTAAASASDVLEFETFNEFNLVNQNLTTPTFKNSMTMKNDTEEDTDGGRESTVIFQGEQSGGEISTLAEIEASHDSGADDEKGNLIFKTNDGSDGTSPTQVAKLDSAGNLLVGANESGIGSSASDTGVVLRGGIGYAEVTRDGGTVGRFNRLTSDGTIVDFAKDGTQVGVIGTKTDKIFIGKGDTGLRFVDSSDRISAFNTSTLADRDAGVDIGSSGARFKDLYLSGGVYIGGTTSSNYLDDFEEGTWTPSITTGTVRGLDCRYTKIGNIVHLRGYFDQWSDQTSGDNIIITGLPFTPVASLEGGAVAVMVRYLDFHQFAVAYITAGGELRLYSIVDNGNYIIREHSHLNSSSANIRINGFYETAS